MKDLISIIVPVYNVEKYLNRCIDSILLQTYNNIEILLIDDGSLDKSSQICDEYMKKDKRIKVIHKKNGGLSDARNAGIDIARGKYITFIDSDDSVEKDLVEYLYKLVINFNTKMSICSHRVIFDEGKRIKVLGNGKEEKSLPIEEIFMLLIPNKDKEKEYKNIMEKFSVFMSSEENSDYIINIIDQISELKDYKMYDFTEYFAKIKSIDLSGLNEE